MESLKMGNIGFEIKKIVDDELQSNSAKVTRILQQIIFAVEILESNNVVENMGSLALQAAKLERITAKYLS